jgi:hypothetical protein
VTVGNLVLRSLDIRLSALAKQSGLTYTRYVDDIVVSGGEGRLVTDEPLIDQIIEDCGWRCGSEKGKLYPPSHYREVLGVSVGGAAKPGHKSRQKIEDAERKLHDGTLTLADCASLLHWRDSVTALGEELDKESASSLTKEPVSPISPVVESSPAAGP